MQKKVLSEQALYYGDVEMPKGFEIDRNKLQSDTLKSQIHNKEFPYSRPWALYLEPSGKEGMKGIKVDLKPGDMLVYSGCELEHWRNKFKGKECIQAFLHYNNRKTPGAKDNMFDKRPHLGLPSWFKK